jgi:hypothetical protein
MPWAGSAPRLCAGAACLRHSLAAEDFEALMQTFLGDPSTSCARLRAAFRDHAVLDQRGKTGQEALEKCAAQMPDTILFDGHVPNRSMPSS